MDFICNNSMIPNSIISQSLVLLKQYNKHLNIVISRAEYDSFESSLNLPSDKNLLDNVEALVCKKRARALKYIIVVGIGGSNLGTKAVYDALFGYYDLLEFGRFPKMIFLDTQNPDVLIKTNLLLEGLTKKDQVVINVISKSGSTTETITNLEVLFSTLSAKFGDVSDRFVLTTDMGSKMHKKADELHIDTLTIPKIVGGRYSVLSAVGLFPMMLANIDVIKLRNGADKIREICVNSSVVESPAAISAAILYQHFLNKKNINDNFIFLPQLESLGKWYRQLMGESIGKDGKGITPTVSIGSTDLHSVGQLYLGGPKDKFTTFIYGQSEGQAINVPTETTFDLVPAIKGKSISKIMRAIVEGTKIAYKKQKLPFVEMIFEKVEEAEIGAFMQFKMVEMMYLGKLLGVNAFDQPHVELYKTETKKILEEEK